MSNYFFSEKHENLCAGVVEFETKQEFIAACARPEFSELDEMNAKLQADPRLSFRGYVANPVWAD